MHPRPRRNLMPDPRPIEIIGGNIYPQAMKNFFTPGPRLKEIIGGRKYRREHLPPDQEGIYA